MTEEITTNEIAVAAITEELKIRIGPDMDASKKKPTKIVASTAGMNSNGNGAKSEGDCRWDELFASTSEEEFTRLRRVLQDEDDGPDTPLDSLIK